MILYLPHPEEPRNAASRRARGTGGAFILRDARFAGSFRMRNDTE
jgi:hypothetical protein